MLLVDKCSYIQQLVVCAEVHREQFSLPDREAIPLCLFNGVCSTVFVPHCSYSVLVAFISVLERVYFEKLSAVVALVIFRRFRPIGEVPMNKNQWTDHLSLIGSVIDVCVGNCSRFHVDTPAESEAVLRALGIEQHFPPPEVRKVDVRPREPGGDISELIEASVDNPLVIRRRGGLEIVTAGQVGEQMDTVTEWSFFAARDEAEGCVHIRINF